MKVRTSFYSGTSNLLLPIKQSEFPEPFEGATRLTYYASLFRSVEINATFYKLPKVATVEKWGKSVPNNFRFTFKVPKGITHAKNLRFNVEDVELFAETAGAVDEKKGCLLVQLPPGLKREKEEELAGLLEILRDNAKGWKIAIEFRHRSWYDRAVYRFIHGYNVSLVHHDMPQSATPMIDSAESFVYIRFHGKDGTYRGNYEKAFLKDYANRIADWVKGGKEVYVYFNNTMGNALGNLQTLNRMVDYMVKTTDQ